LSLIAGARIGPSDNKNSVSENKAFASDTVPVILELVAVVLVAVVLVVVVLGAVALVGMLHCQFGVFVLFRAEERKISYFSSSSLFSFFKKIRSSFLIIVLMNRKKDLRRCL
jgi:membrane-bound ClpP family serine protease